MEFQWQNGTDHAAAADDWPIVNARFRRSRALDGSLRSRFMPIEAVDVEPPM